MNCLRIFTFQLDNTYLSSPKLPGFLVKDGGQKFTLKKGFKKGKRLSIYVACIYSLIVNTNERIYKQINSPMTVAEFNPTKVVSKFIRIAGRKLNKERHKHSSNRLLKKTINQIFQKIALP